MENKIFKLILLIFVFKVCIQQRRKCVDVATFKGNHQNQLSPAFSIDTFVANSIPTKTKYPDRYLGGGSFGKVFRFSIRNADGNKWLNSALKVIRYTSDEKEELDVELKFHQKYSRENPLTMVRYYGCIVNSVNKTAIIISEQLNRPIDEDNYIQPIFKKYNFRVKVGLFLKMAEGLKVFFDNGYAHMDVKPDNFMADDTKVPIIKTIDYGLAEKHSENTFGGTSFYMDPNIYKKPNYGYYNARYEVTSKSDVYSLGITFQEMLYDDSNLGLARICDTSYNNKKVCCENRYNKVKTSHNNIERNLPANVKQSIRKLNVLIQDMIEVELVNRPNIDRVVDRLVNLLEGIEPDSIYLPKNKEALITALYGELGTHNTPVPIGEIKLSRKEIQKQREEEERQRQQLLEEQRLKEIQIAKQKEEADRIAYEQRKAEEKRLRDIQLENERQQRIKQEEIERLQKLKEKELRAKRRKERELKEIERQKQEMLLKKQQILEEKKRLEELKQQELIEQQQKALAEAKRNNNRDANKKADMFDLQGKMKNLNKQQHQIMKERNINPNDKMDQKQMGMSAMNNQKQNMNEPYVKRAPINLFAKERPKKIPTKVNQREQLNQGDIFNPEVIFQKTNPNNIDISQRKKEITRIEPQDIPNQAQNKQNEKRRNIFKKKDEVNEVKHNLRDRPPLNASHLLIAEQFNDEGRESVDSSKAVYNGLNSNQPYHANRQAQNIEDFEVNDEDRIKPINNDVLKRTITKDKKVGLADMNQSKLRPNLNQKRKRISIPEIPKPVKDFLKERKAKFNEQFNIQNNEDPKRNKLNIRRREKKILFDEYTVKKAEIESKYRDLKLNNADNEQIVYYDQQKDKEIKKINKEFHNRWNEKKKLIDHEITNVSTVIHNI